MSETTKITSVADGAIFYHFKTEGELLLLAIVKNFTEGIVRKLHSKKQASLLFFTSVDGLLRLETYNLYRAGPLITTL